jgi:diguanylate cyclase (GGDEF)-like protein
MFLGSSVLTAGSLTVDPADPRQFLVRLSDILTADSAADAMMAEILKALKTIPQIEACWFGRPDDEGRINPHASAGLDSATLASIKRLSNMSHGPYSEGPSGRAWRSGLPHFTADWRNDPGVAAWQLPARGLNLRSSASIPLRGRTGAHSLLGIYSNTEGFFPDIWPPEVLSHLAALIGNALENREKHADLLRARQLYQTLFKGADHLLSARSESNLFRVVCKTLVDSGLFVSAGVGIVGPDGIHRHVAAAARRNTRALRTASYKYEKGQALQPLTLDAWEAGRTLIANDYFGNPKYACMYKLARKLGFRSIAALIIRRGGLPWAVLSVSAADIDYFDCELMPLLERMAAMVGHRLDELDLKAALRAERETQSRIAREDTLTQLPNRLAFQEQLNGSMARALRHCSSVGIGMIDLDDFKQINDQWGHAAGDHVLRVVGGRIRSMLRDVDFVARLGGDEFALILEGWIAAPEQWAQGVEAFCMRLREAVGAPVALPNGQTINVSLSAGFTLFPLGDAAPDLLVRQADMALYAAKAGKGESGRFWRLYRDPKLGNDEQFHNRNLLQQGALQVHFQPVLNLDDEKIIAVEALARLRDGDELIQPRKFMPDLTLEDRCLLFRQVLDDSLRRLALLDDEGFSLNVSVNVDAQVLLLDKTLPYIKKALAQTGIESKRLVLEILETHEFLDVKRAAAQIKAARALGIRVALDDLGAGYSSILKIRELPLDVVKLDRAFVSGLREQPDDLMFISVIQTLTASLGIKLIVEGVEDEDVLDALRMVGVRHVQGFVIAAPMRGEALPDWLRHYQKRPASTEPATLLGAYALHSNWIRVFEFWRLHPPTLSHLQRNNPFSLNGYFAGTGMRHKAARDAYETLQALLRHPGVDRQLVLDAAGYFRGKLIAALKTEG